MATVQDARFCLVANTGSSSVERAIRDRSMSGWLRLREPYDHASRSLDLTAAFSQAVGPDAQLLDLACGTGSNVRYLAPKLGRMARWTCVDRDETMLRRARETLGDGAFRYEQRDLADELHTLSPGSGVTCSAFLDLCGAGWLDTFSAWCAGTPLLAAMTFDGRVEWDPVDPLDERVHRAWLATKCEDLGLGPSLGPDAAAYLAQRLREHGQYVEVVRSDWSLATNARDLLGEMVGGIVRRTLGQLSDSSLDSWLSQRTRQIAAEKLSLRIGHVDLLSLPR
jgi:hypothetical protein